MEGHTSKVFQAFKRFFFVKVYFTLVKKTLAAIKDFFSLVWLNLVNMVSELSCKEILFSNLVMTHPLIFVVWHFVLIQLIQVNPFVSSGVRWSVSLIQLLNILSSWYD